jgi:hypothetical protein
MSFWLRFAVIGICSLPSIGNAESIVPSLPIEWSYSTQVLAAGESPRLQSQLYLGGFGAHPPLDYFLFITGRERSTHAESMRIPVMNFSSSYHIPGMGPAGLPDHYQVSLSITDELSQQRGIVVFGGYFFQNQGGPAIHRREGLASQSLVLGDTRYFISFDTQWSDSNDTIYADVTLHPSISSTPEPSSLILLTTALSILLLFRKHHFVSHFVARKCLLKL